MKPDLLRRMRAVFPIHEAFYMHDVTVKCTPSNATRAIDDLSIAILGLPGCGDYTYRLERLSELHWEYPDLIELYFSFSQIESVTIVVTSDSLGDIGFLQLKRAELSNRLVIRNMLVCSETDNNVAQITLSFVLRPFQPQREGMPLNNRLPSFFAMMVEMKMIGDSGGDFFDPHVVDRIMVPLREASRSWTGYRIRHSSLKAAITLMSPRRASGAFGSDIDELIAWTEIAIGLSINASLGKGLVDIHEMGRSVETYADLLRNRHSRHCEVDDDLGQFIEAQKLAFIFPHDPRISSSHQAINSLSYALSIRHSRVPEDRHVLDCDEVLAAARAAFDGDYLESPPHPQARCLVVKALLNRFQETSFVENLVDAKATLGDGALSSKDELYGEMLALQACTLAFLSASDDLAGMNAAVSMCYKALEEATGLGQPGLARRFDIYDALLAVMHKLDLSQPNPFRSGKLDIIQAREDVASALRSYGIRTTNDTIASKEFDFFMELSDAFMRLFFERDDGPSEAEVHRMIAATEKAIEFLDDEAPPSQRVGMWGSLGTQHRYLYLLTHDQENLDNAIQSLRISLSLQSDDENREKNMVHEVIPGAKFLREHLSRLGLGNLLATRFRATNDICDIQESIFILRTSLKALPAGHPYESHITFLLGSALIDEGGESVEEGLSMLSKSASVLTGPPRDRLTSAQHFALESFRLRGPEHSIEAFDLFIGLYVTISNTRKTAEGRYEFLEQFSEQVLQAVLCAIHAGRLDKALEWMEQGRGLVWTQLRNLRSPLEDLRTAHPDLAKRLETVSWYLEDAEGHVLRPESRAKVLGDAGQAARYNQVAQYFELAREREDILETIQNATPGFEKFLQPLSCRDRMIHLPKLGHVIVINVHEARCDALVLVAGRDKPFHIPLPNFSLGLAVQLQRLIRAQLNRYKLRTRWSESDRSIGPADEVSRKNQQNPMQTVLRELWLHVAKPVIDALALSRSDNPTARVWWCPTGLLTFLPLHAAGIYSGDSPVTLADYVVSSYTPTVAVLAEIVAKPRCVPTENPILLVSVPAGKGAHPIPGTTVEVDKIHGLMSSSSARSLKLQGEDATVEAGLRGMKNHSWIHLACHAKQDASQPLKSGFLFRDNRLDLSTIIKCNLNSADFAFLSACQTSTGHEKLSEEAVHLAAGMLAAGYRGVVATMWSIPDLYAPMIAENFYSNLLSRSSTTLDKDSTIDSSYAAYSIHHAVKKLRAEIGDSEAAMLAWVPYVHYGL